MGEAMALVRAIIALYFVSVIFVSGFLDYDIIEGYLGYKFLNYASVIGCFNKKELYLSENNSLDLFGGSLTEQLKITKKFMVTKMISVLNIDKLDVTRSLESLSHLGVILDGDCKEAHAFLLESGNHNYFNERHHWLILTSKRNYSYLFRDVEMYVNSDIETVYPDQKFNAQFWNYTLEEVYNPSSKHSFGLMSYNQIGFYNDIDGFNIGKRKECKYFTRRNMTGVHLKTMIGLPIPFKGELSDYLRSKADKEINTFNRFQHNLLLSCQSYYNFTYEISMNRKWGYRQKNGSFDGMVGALVRKDIDYGTSPVYVIQERIGAIDFGKKTWDHRTGFLFRNPQTLTSIEALVKPLSVSTWILTLLSAVILWFLLRLSCLYEEQVHEQVDVTWSYYTICIVGALCQQGMPVTPRFSSGRIVTLFLFLFALLMYQFYSASLVSSLLMERPTKIKTLDDLARSNLKAGSEDYLYNKLYFTKPPDKASKKIYLEKILGSHNTSNFMSAQKGLELVHEGGYAFNAETNAAYPIIRKTFSNKAICELRVVQLNKPHFLYTIYPKHSPFKEMFDSCLQRLDEGGIITRDTLLWDPPKPDCLQSSVSGTFNIGLDEFYPALLVLAFGIALSLLILVYEKFRFPIERQRKAKKTFIYPFMK